MLAGAVLRSVLRGGAGARWTTATLAAASRSRRYASTQKDDTSPSSSSSAPTTEVPSSPEAVPILPTDATASPFDAASQITRAPPQESLASSEPAEDAPRARASGSRGGDGLPDSAYISSTDRKRNALAKYFGYGSLLGLVGGTLYLGRELDEHEKKLHPTIGGSWDAFFTRVNARRKDFLDFYNEPPFQKLLPDPVPEYGRPYTLVISLEDLMVHSEWSREYGWRIAKRPGLDYFLAYLFQYYEIVVFTSQPEHTAIPIIQKVDQYPGYIMYPLFRPHTRYVDGKYVKVHFKKKSFLSIALT